MFPDSYLIHSRLFMGVCVWEEGLLLHFFRSSDISNLCWVKIGSEHLAYRDQTGLPEVKNQNKTKQLKEAH